MTGQTSTQTSTLTSTLTSTTVYYTASSLDGFLATEDHSLSWLLSQDIDPDGPMNHAAFMAGVGAMAMGASTYAWILEHEGPHWGPEVPTWVLTHREIAAASDRVRVVAADTPEDLARVHADLVAAAGGRAVWLVGGGELVGSFADLGLLDELWVSFAPVTLGSGRPLLPRRLDLELVEVARNRAFTCARLRLLR